MRIHCSKVFSSSCCSQRRRTSAITSCCVGRVRLNTFRFDTPCCTAASNFLENEDLRNGDIEADFGLSESVRQCRPNAKFLEIGAIRRS